MGNLFSFLLFLRSDRLLSEFQFDDEWSDSDKETKLKNVETDLSSAIRRIRTLEKKLAGAKQNLVDYRAFVGERLNVAHLTDTINDASPAPTPARDGDSQYFESHGGDDICFLDFFWM